MNYIPLEINVLLILNLKALFLTRFFKESWSFFYRVAIALLKYYEDKILKLTDFPSIVG